MQYIIYNTRQDTYGRVIGECCGRKVRFVEATQLWAWDDPACPRGYLFNVKVI
jgi:hypothetical protein